MPETVAVSAAVLITFYADALDTQSETREVAWDTLAAYFFTNHEESACALEGPARCAGKKCPYKARSGQPKKPMAFVPGVLDGARLDKNVRALTLLVLDYDHVSEAGAGAVECALEASGLERVLYTTHSHHPPDDCAFRVVIPLSHPVGADQWHRFLPAAIAYLGVSLASAQGDVQPDPVCKNRSRLYFLPSHPRGAPYGAERAAGAPLDVDRVLAWAADNPEAVSVPEGSEWSGVVGALPEARTWAGDDLVQVARAAARYFPPRRRNEFCLALAGMLRRAGATEDDARWVVYEAARAGGSDNPVARARTVDHTYALGETEPLSGYTRLSEIVGEPAARALGEAIADARNNAVLRDFEGGGGSPVSGGGGRGVSGGGEPETAAGPVSDLSDVRRRLGRLAAQRGRSLDRDDRIGAILLRRALGGEPLARPGGVGDPETVRTQANRGLLPEEAVRTLVFLAAGALPGVSFAVLLEVFRDSLARLGEAPPPPAPSWGVFSEAVHQRALRHGRARQAERALEAARERSAVLEGFVAASSTPTVSAALPETWRDQLRKRGDGSLLPLPHNARVLLECDPVFRGVLGWNEVGKRVEIRTVQGPLARYAGPQPIDSVTTGIQDILAAAYDLPVGHQDVARRVVAIARRNPFDPLKDYLSDIRWDGATRVNTWLSAYCGAEDTDYARLVGRRWLLALVARGLRPGTKVDNVLVFEAAPGVGKSSVFEILAGEWYCDTAIVLGDKDSRMLAGLYWICELAELVAFKRTGHEALKNFLSSRIDKFRPPYGRSYEESPRRCLFVGTTNEDHYLGDETGNRKYWCVACSFIEGALDRLRHDRDALLAEAVVLYWAAENCANCRGGAERCIEHRWWFGYRELALTEGEAEQRMVDTPARLKIESWWHQMAPADRPSILTTMEVAEAALNATPAQTREGLLKAVGHALSKMGFQRRRDTMGLRTWRYYATKELLQAPHVARYVPGSGKVWHPQVIQGGK